MSLKIVILYSAEQDRKELKTYIPNGTQERNF